jgi:hypothetical protein
MNHGLAAGLGALGKSIKEQKAQISIHSRGKKTSHHFSISYSVFQLTFNSTHAQTPHKHHTNIITWGEETQIACHHLRKILVCEIRQKDDQTMKRHDG